MILRRRRIPILPLLAVGCTVVLSVAITFGKTRYRSPFEVSLVLMSAVMLEWIWTQLGAAEGDHRSARLATPSPGLAPAGPVRPLHVGRPRPRASPPKPPCRRRPDRAGDPMELDTDVLVVVPAYNEASSVASVVAEVLQAAPKVHVLVVDDASTDATATPGP